jgi:hypothetical protein
MAFGGKHISPARAAWKNFDHYRRLEEHGEPLPWHGRKAWRRVILTGLLLVAIATAGLYRRYEEWRMPDRTEILKPLTASGTVTPPRL